MKNLGKLSLIAGIMIIFALAGCNQPRDGAVDNELYDENMDNTENTAIQSDNMQNGMDVTEAVAVIHSNDTDINGWVTFTKVSDGVRVEAEVTGLSEGEHGFHLHTYGDCRANDYTSAGPHYMQANKALWSLGPITANSEGIATINYVDSAVVLDEIIGRGVVVHHQDGSRAACGSIGYANTGTMNGDMNMDM